MVKEGIWNSEARKMAPQLSSSLSHSLTTAFVTVWKRWARPQALLWSQQRELAWSLCSLYTKHKPRGQQQRALWTSRISVVDSREMLVRVPEYPWGRPSLTELLYLRSFSSLGLSFLSMNSAELDRLNNL